MLAVFNAHWQFMRSLRATLDGAQYATAVLTHTKRMKDGFAKLSPITMSDANDTMAAITAADISADTKKELATCIMHLVDTGAPPPDGAAVPSAQPKEVLRPQTCYFLHRYMTKEDWATLQCYSLAWEVRLEAVVNRCRSLGLLSLTERTAVHTTCVMLMSQGSAIQQVDAYAKLQSLKKAFATMRRLRTDIDKPSVMIFPADPAEFMKDFKGRYEGTDGPIASKISETQLTNLHDRMPARHTHRSLQQGAIICPEGTVRGGGAHDAKQYAGLINALQASGCVVTKRLAIEDSTPPPKRSRLAIENGQATGSETVTPKESIDDDDADADAARPDGADGDAGGGQMMADVFGAAAGTANVPEPEFDGAADKAAAAVEAALRTKKADKAAEKSASPASSSTTTSKAKSAPKSKAAAKAAATPNPVAKAKAKSKAAAAPAAAVAKAKAESAAAPSTAAPKAKAKAGAVAKAGVAPQATAKAKAKAKPVTSTTRPPMPPLKQGFPIRYHHASIYTCEAANGWRVVTLANRRFDKKFSWKGGNDAWAVLCDWIEANCSAPAAKK